MCQPVLFPSLVALLPDATLLKKLVEYRKTHNLTQAELANILGVTRESLYRWVTGKVKLIARVIREQSKDY